MGQFTLPDMLAEKARQGQLVSAYLLTGAPDAALEDCARALAAACLCKGPEPPCGTCKSCRKVEKDIHPDLQWVEKLPDKTQLTVDQIRQIRQQAYIRPNEAPRKVTVLRRAWQMNDEAQNAFLKVLEEGPAYAVFILLAENAAALLPTIRSRCQLVTVADRAAATAHSDPELERKAGELAGLLLGDDPWRRVGWCVAMEKAKREEVLPLWEATRQALLTYRTPKTQARAVRLAQCLRELEGAAQGVNANMGVLWGRLWSECDV